MKFQLILCKLIPLQLTLFCVIYAIKLFLGFWELFQQSFLQLDFIVPLRDIKIMKMTDLEGILTVEHWSSRTNGFLNLERFILFSLVWIFSSLFFFLKMTSVMVSQTRKALKVIISYLCYKVSTTSMNQKLRVLQHFLFIVCCYWQQK